MKLLIDTNVVLDILLRREPYYENKESLVALLTKLFEAFRIAAVSETSIREALDLKWDDFEDCVQYSAGKNINADYIIIRNAKDFAKSQINVITPNEFLDIITDYNT